MAVTRCEFVEKPYWEPEIVLWLTVTSASPVTSIAVLRRLAGFANVLPVTVVAEPPDTDTPIDVPSKRLPRITFPLEGSTSPGLIRMPMPEGLLESAKVRP